MKGLNYTESFQEFLDTLVYTKKKKNLSWLEKMAAGYVASL